MRWWKRRRQGRGRMEMWMSIRHHDCKKIEKKRNGGVLE
jgi:hypothetical protein